MKRIISVISLCAMALCLACGCAAKGSDETVTVESVAMITGLGSVGVVDSFAGKVVSGETAEIKRDADKTVLEVFVKEGDMVKQGDKLFAYDTEAMRLSLDKLYLDRESLENTISAAETEIDELERQKANASASQQLSYTLQIDARRADIREAEYNLALKDKEISAMEASMDKTEVTTPLSGRVMTVGSLDDNNSAGGEMGMYGDGSGTGASDAFITVMDISAYRIEGHINELNRGSITEGMDVVIRSRMDEDRTWAGTITAIDWEKPVTGNNNSMYYVGNSGDEMTSSSKYPFYVTLGDTGDLLLGQHVYIEPDYDADAETPALMLPAYYIGGADGGSPFVWAANSKDKLEKRPVTLGAYDDMMDTYEITAGLDATDYIAFMDDSLSAGMAVTRFDESSFGGEDDMYDGDGVISGGFVAPAGAIAVG